MGEVQEPWTRVASLGGGGGSQIGEQWIEVMGEAPFEHEEDGWEIVHHHTDLSPAMIEVLERLAATD